MNIGEFYEQFANVDIGDLSNNQMDIMYKELGSALPTDMQTVEEHRKYVEMLRKLRMANAKDMERVGAKFLDTIKSLLAVGEDGVYSNSQRFIYELIQNVDDCEYQNPENCHLDIKFVYDNGPGKIILTYNENGFKPENVFAITGIAEKSKNISHEKVEIGEKGIGFKSVFGIAEKVHIESGSFSFELCRDNFTVPNPKYDDFSPIKGTRLTLEMSSDIVKKIYRNMTEKYIKKDAALNQNPILFLNKLTHLKMYFDGFRYIEFDVQRKEPEIIGNIAFENDVVVSVNMKDHKNGIDKTYSSTIRCKRYMQPIIYGERECKARYGEDVLFSEKRHNLIVLFPVSLDGLKDYKGLMYSFLPMQIQMSVPIILHAPFKLDGSREFVDPQGENAWFSHTIKNLEIFLKRVYVHLASVVKQDIITYIPNRHSYFFRKTNEKVQCLLKNDLKGDAICQEKVFYTANGTYEKSVDIVSFANTENIHNPTEVFALLGENKKLFIPNYSVKMDWYNVRVISNVSALLFKKGLKDEKKFPEIAKMLDSIGKELEYVNLIEESCPLELTKNQLLVINAHRTIYKALNKYGKQCLEEKKPLQVSFATDVPVMDAEFGNDIQELTRTVSLDKAYENYLESTDYRFYKLKGVGEEFAIAGSEGIVVAEEFPRGSFAELTKKYDSQKVFVATLQIQQASDKLNETDESMSDADYLKLLRSVRSSMRISLGEKAYNSYIQIINQAGIGQNRFLNELLQNADDCKYVKDEVPTFDLRINNNQIIVSYNEIGFKQQNVRAITAIGESTKKLLLSGEDRSIGEKGVGFKSVFSVAESVEIHSNGFDFKLMDKTPTIPNKCDAIDVPGTTLIFNMKSDIRQVLKEDKIIRLCLCLRNLKKINIQNISVNISDIDKERIIFVGEKKYQFEKFTYDFRIEDEEAIEERAVNQHIVSNEQSIYCYIPKESKIENYSLYVGLPTAVNCNIPLIVDAPFELTTSRENVIHSKWNALIRDAMYRALFKLMDSKKDLLGIDVLKYIKFTSRKKHRLSYDNFSDSYLNEFKWELNLKKAKIIPVLNHKQFVSVEETKCVLVPEVIAFIFQKSQKKDIYSSYDGAIVDTGKKTQYFPLLRHIGCSQSDVKDDLNCIMMVASSMIINKKFRDVLYSYLQDKAAQGELAKQGLYERVKELPVFPIRTKEGTQYVPYSPKIYTHQNRISDEDFLILETKILEYDKVEKILGNTERINELSEEVYEARYQTNLVSYLKSGRSEKEKAIYLLNEYKNNFINLKKCRDTLKGMITEIPMEFLSGRYQVGNKFINGKGLILSGDVIKNLVVSDSFVDLANCLGCTDILEIHYDDIDVRLENISDEDIQDFQNEFTYGLEILEELIRDRIISDGQIEKYNLEYLIRLSDEDEEEDFPGKAVTDLEKLRKHVYDCFKMNPNPYVEKKQVIRVPKNSVNKDAYLTSMYRSEYTTRKCFCQMCQKSVPKNYIEHNDVQKLPQYGWSQMYLNLCLNCSKDYTSLRNNGFVWNKFIHNILEANTEDDETVRINIGNREIVFTATHLAEIQTILELENESV